MPKRILQVVESAYRATLEEQDDTVLWITQAMKGAGGDFSVLLRGNAVNYAVKGQEASGLAFGDKRQTQPPRITDDVARLVEKGVEVFVVSDDLAERGLERGDLIAGPKPVWRDELANLFEPYDMIWHGEPNALDGLSMRLRFIVSRRFEIRCRSPTGLTEREGRDEPWSIPMVRPARHRWTAGSRARARALSRSCCFDAAVERQDHVVDLERGRERSRLCWHRLLELGP